MIIAREIVKIICTCGKEGNEGTPTKDELNYYGCGNDKTCCVRIIECIPCKIRLILKLEPPEIGT